ncbi:MAG: hypothetical protein Ct9H300mP12_02220 [Acidimicrobiales bacterium]|nr:MAG: hypothetical protein Ct9H300mP12_02220 [Acidimicrobiales bacterium]
MFALLGPNGAGKSTTVEILEGIAVETPAPSRCWPRSGHGTNGFRDRIGIVLQEVGVERE